ncbi:MAG: DUF3232 domain-containing protein [Clostridia bacterium]|nr:DUF3232 domain-containing protein [Clostridia bacterium]
MKVKNDFPKIDTVIRKLKDYVRYFERKQEELKTSTDERAKKQCEFRLKYVDDFIKSIENYLDSVCNGDARIEKFRISTDDIKAIQDAIEQEDRLRTARHSAVITNMIMIDRTCKRENMEMVFDYADEFVDSYSSLLPNSVAEKSRMTERERIKRRELGNFGLYIAASVTAGMVMEDREIREFANCEGDVPKVDTNTFTKVKDNSKGVKRNMNIILE